MVLQDAFKESESDPLLSAESGANVKQPEDGENLSPSLWNKAGAGKDLEA